MRKEQIGIKCYDEQDGLGRLRRIPPFRERGQLIGMLYLPITPLVILLQIKKNIGVISVEFIGRRPYGSSVGCRGVDCQHRPTVKVSRRGPVLSRLYRECSESPSRRVIHSVNGDRVGFQAFKKNLVDDCPIPGSPRRPAREDASSDILGLPQRRQQFTHVSFENAGTSSNRNCAFTNSSGSSAASSYRARRFFPSMYEKHAAWPSFLTKIRTDDVATGDLKCRATSPSAVG